MVLAMHHIMTMYLRSDQKGGCLASSLLGMPRRMCGLGERYVKDMFVITIRKRSIAPNKHTR
jgi:hypothetical protein